ncbi:dicer [Schizosaccharomyces pombe]|uniref:Protein Dicer n=1 Tax=Schizosaccharomyces pombe (strain 972 / ATCC 24843) TaxID=284812 RepID=DCR1_SCHPO|nr:dicer [Schizosaccharomyces pombe]Q09884.1 RecName: Full=Protein Dicer; AltName: Full=Cell cycle control protein dcr1; AltName: Full=RNA interference pathway protein dcr1; Includes: RecName: Full=Endoribonuclease dcr1; Includes: RecName: Full=ATP-dependent helicase dcr1 [Schizosaccharomyces pombe 972h-]CAB41233.2 dicer [Schizosaccharomyces pombe]|eukprot:NP_588215.2 dicer [Schizosaccharomyces pombe]
MDISSFLLPQLLRKYQQDVYNIASKQNTLLVMRTGAGKTLLAVKLIKQKLEEQILIQESNLEHKKISVFLVNKVPLVFQQAEYIRSQLPAKVGMFYGELSIEMSEQLLTNIILKYNVIVITADLFYLFLARGFLSINDLNLIIFDECHHAIGNDAYARIMNDFYHRAKAVLSKKHFTLPRIFGMTASPFTGKKGNLYHRLYQWEQLFDSKAHVVSENELADYFCLPEESYVMYSNKLVVPPSDSIIKKCEETLQGCKLISRAVKTALAETIDMGLWFGEQVWLYLVDFVETKRLKKKALGKQLSDDEELAIDRLKIFVEDWKNNKYSDNGPRIPVFDSTDVTDKVFKLLELLKATYRKSDSVRTVIFVERKATAFTLSLFMKTLNLPNIRAHSFIGHGPSDQGEFSMTFRRQKDTLHKFKTGKYNVLIATAVAEEGIDVPSCNLVIRFNICRTVTQYVQSRGRARAMASKFLIFLNTEELLIHERILHEEKNLKFALSELSNSNIFDSLVCEERERVTDDIVYEVGETGALLTGLYAVSLLYNFCNTLSRDVYTRYYPTFTAQPCLSGWYCFEVELPKACKVPAAQGSPAKSIRKAKQNAAFIMCLDLIRMGLIDKHLKPLDFRRKIADLETLEEDELKDEGYIETYERYVPKSWMKVPEDITRCFVSLLYTDANEGDNHIFHPLVFVQAHSFPKIDSFILNSTVGPRVKIVLETIEDSFKIDSHLLELLKKSTRYLLQFGLSTSLEQQIPTPYWLAPLNLSCTDYRFLENLIDVDTIQNFFKLPEPVQNVTDLQSDTVLLVNPQSIYEQYAFEGFVNSEFMIPAKKKDKAPSALCKKLPLRLNYSLWGNRAKSIPKSQQVRSFYINDLYILPVSRHLKNSALLIPSILYHIENLLVASSFIEHFRLDCKIDTACQALTSAESQLNFDYDRLEFYGDCFLKLGASITVFLKFPDTQEYQLHFNRKKIISNCNLYKVAIDCELPKYALSTPLEIRHWCPYGFQKSTSDKCRYAVLQKLSVKRIADMVEASIGACLLDSGLDSALKICKSLSVGLLDISNWDEWNNYFDLNTYADSLRNVQFPYSSYIEETIGYSFKNKKLLHLAFIHPSMMSQQGIYENYQQLEFLGDAVLDYIIVQYLYKKYPNATSGELTDYKSFYVCNKSLSYIGFVLNLHKYIQHESAAMCDAIFEYQELIEAFRETASENPWFWFEIDSPKFISDTLEAMICAIFLDSGFSLQSLQFVLPLFLNSLGDATHTKAKGDIEHKVYQLLKDQGCEDFGTKCVIEEVKSSHKTLLNTELHLTKYYGFSFFRHGNIVAYGKSRKVANAKYIMKQRLLKLLEDKSNLLLYSCNCKFSKKKPSDEQIKGDGKVKSLT